MKILSIRQPFAWLVVNGIKDIENRNWTTSYTGPVLVHTGKGMTNDEYIGCVELTRKIAPDVIIPNAWNLDFGGYVGVTHITDCVHESNSPWFSGRYGFVLEGSMPVDFVPAKGRLGLVYAQPGSVEHAVMERVWRTSSR